MKIYTKTGDKGYTGLFNGQRVRKNSLRVDTYGTVDELNSILGIVRSYGLPEDFDNDIKKISHDLFKLGADLATPISEDGKKDKVERIAGKCIEWLEMKIDEYTEKLPPLNYFILPGGSKPAAFMHQARTVCRRAERLLTELDEDENTGEFTVKYLNRLSDYLFTAARMANFINDVDDIKAEFK